MTPFPIIPVLARIASRRHDTAWLHLNMVKVWTGWPLAYGELRLSFYRDLHHPGSCLLIPKRRKDPTE